MGELRAGHRRPGGQGDELKRRPGDGDLALFGSSTLTASLLGAGVVDEVRVMVNPVLLAAACPCSPGSPAGSRCGSPAPSRSATATCCSATHPKRCSRAPDMSGPDVLARRVLPSPAMLWAMRAEDEFAGSAVCTAWQHLWPFDRAVLTIAHDWIDCERPSGRRTFRRREDGAVVTLVPYRYVPFLVRSLIWIDQHQRDGFVPFRARAVRRSLAAHGWEVEPETRSWISWVGRLWGRSAANRRVAR